MKNSATFTSDRAARYAAFISHKSNDAELARDLCEGIEANGLTCWIAPRNVTPGHSYAVACVEGIESSEALILLASALALASPQILSEIDQAHKRGIPIYTILLGRPKISKEVDYYISRLHWLEAGSSSAETLAATLAAVMTRALPWEDAAQAPSFLRNVIYLRTARLRAALVSFAIFALAIYGTVWQLNRGLDADFRRLAYVEVAAQGTPMKLTTRVWLLASDTRFKDLRLTLVGEGDNGEVHPITALPWPVPEQVGSSEILRFSPSFTVGKLTTCLDVRSAVIHGPTRVTQRFALRRAGDEVTVSPVSEATVTTADGHACGSAR